MSTVYMVYTYVCVCVTPMGGTRFLREPMYGQLITTLPSPKSGPVHISVNVTINDTRCCPLDVCFMIVPADQGGPPTSLVVRYSHMP